MTKRQQNTEVLARVLEFYERGTQQHFYPEGTRVADLSAEALEWLKRNRDQPELKGLITERKISAEERVALTAEIDAAAIELAEAEQAVQEAAAAIVAATDALQLRDATDANTGPASRLQRLRKRFDVLTSDSPEQLVTAVEQRIASRDTRAALATAEREHEDSVRALKEAKKARKRARRGADADAAEVAEKEAGEVLAKAEEVLGQAQQDFAALDDA